MHVRPRMPEQHRHTPSLRGGDAEERQRRGGKKKKKKKQSGTEIERERERVREAERGRERLGERGEEGGSGRLADVTSALNQSLQPWSHGFCPLMP